MKETDSSFDWRELPGELAARGRDLWKAGLGMIDMVEEAGEKVVATLRTDRARVVEDIQERGSKAMDELQAEANRLFDGLIERGERLQKKGAHLVGKTAADWTAGPRDLAAGMERTVEETVASVMHRMDIPTRSEVQRLTARVERLTLELRRMAARLAGEDVAPSVTEFEVVFVDGKWVVREEGGSAMHTASKKGDAVKAAREMARNTAPARLRILKLDGDLQDESSYE